LKISAEISAQSLGAIIRETCPEIYWFSWVLSENNFIVFFFFIYITTASFVASGSISGNLSPEAFTVDHSAPDLMDTYLAAREAWLADWQDSLCLPSCNL
jgi:hypothetical protein